MGLVESDQGRSIGHSRLRAVRDGDGERDVQHDRDGVRGSVPRDRQFGSPVSLADRAVVGERWPMNIKRQQKIHWIVLHVADGLLIILVLAILWVLLGTMA